MPDCLPEWWHFFFVPTSNVYKRDLISPHSCQHLSTMCLFYDNYSSGCEVVTHCGFDLHFLGDKWCYAPFHLLIGHWSLFFGDISNQTLPITDLFLIFEKEKHRDRGQILSQYYEKIIRKNRDKREKEEHVETTGVKKLEVK